MVLVLFFWSGVTGLIYEVFWSKYLALLFGSTMQAQTVVLATFMGGLALGNRWFGGRADHCPRPLSWYGLLELGIGLYAFCFYWLYQLADAIFTGVGAKIIEQTALLLSLKAALSIILLLGPTILMGGTLPVLAAWLQRQYLDGNRWSARFYAINTFGAVLGAWLAGFFLVRWLGMVSSLQMTALVNVVVGFTALGLARRPSATVPPVVASADTGLSAQGLPHPDALASSTMGGATPAEACADRTPLRLGCWLVAVTGGVSIGLEVLAARALAMIFGPSLQAFAIVLMAFILGIGIGSAVMASPRVRRWPRERTTFVLLLVAGGLLGVYVQGLERWVDLYRFMMIGLARNEMGYRLHLWANGLIALLLLGLPAALLGAVLPLWMREGTAAKALGGWVGRLLTWNTVGAVLGVLVTGFGLMPLLGLRAAFAGLAVLLSAVAVLLAWSRLSRLAVILSGGTCAFLTLIGCSGGEGWRYVLSSGVFRARETDIASRAIELRKKYKLLLFYQDAADATVSVERGVGGVGLPELGLRINGKPDATTRSDLSTQYLLAHLPLLARPQSQDVFVLGFGSGITAGALLGHPIGRLDIAENCGAVLRAGTVFAPYNRGVLTNQRAHVWHEDARTVLKLNPQRYDVIISEPSNPWTAGIGSVFSQEFFEIAARRLKPGGVMAQWFHLYEMHDGIVALVLRTFGSVFPFVEIWDTSSGDIVLLGSQQPWSSSPEIFRQVWARPQPRQELQAIGLTSPAAIWARQLASQATAFALAGEGAIQSDEFPVLEYAAPLAFYLGQDSHLLLDYDERTWQTDLASPAKRNTLAALTEVELQPIFAEYHSLNPDLMRYLSHRFATPAAANDPELARDDPRLPCIFRSPQAWTNLSPPAPGDNVELHRLWQAAMALQLQPAQRGRTLDEMIQLLGAFHPAAARPAETRSVLAFADLAARISLAAQDWTRTQQLLARARQLDPAWPHARYLDRILQRERPASTGLQR